MWDIFTAVLLVIKAIAMVGLAVGVAAVLGIIGSYLEIGERVKTLYGHILVFIGSRRMKKKAKKEAAADWEKFFFSEFEKGFHDTGEIITPHAAPRGEDPHDLESAEESK